MAINLQRHVNGRSAPVDTLVAPEFASDETVNPPYDLDNGAPVVVHNARRSFKGKQVLGGVSLEIAQGEFVALLGRSGVGKSTLLRALAGLDPETSGILQVPDRRAVVFQDARLLPWVRVLDNIVLGISDRDARDRGRKALEEVGLSAHERSWPGTLSGGEAQRTALARALVREPALLLLDEPFGALDALTRIQMHALLSRLCEVHQPAVLLVTHDVDEAVLLADRVLVMADGQIAAERRVEIPHPRQRHHDGFAELRSELLACLGVFEVDDEAATLASPWAFQADESTATTHQ